MIRIIKKIGNKIAIILCNLFIMIVGVFIKRDSKVIIVGAWMGEKFADNSRFLFQFLHINKDNLQIRDVVWVTREESSKHELENKGYHVVLCGTRESLFYHIKAGIHILCNSTITVGDKLPDIDTKYSWGAKKIQLWHGSGFKSVGRASNNLRNVRESTLQRIYKKTFISSLGYPGGWDNAFVLCTSEYNYSVNKLIMGCDDDHLFISCYPRNCECLNYFASEKKVFNVIRSFEGCILYLPTFRSDYSLYTHPLDNPELLEYLKNNRLLWIEKPHSASVFRYNKLSDNKNVLMLDDKFDVNVLYDHISVLVSDYSSAISDAIYKNIPTIIYAPDIDIFKNGDVGFLIDMEEYFGDILIKNMPQILCLLDQIKNNEYFTNQRVAVYDKTRKDYFGDIVSSYSRVWNDILKL